LSAPPHFHVRPRCHASPATSRYGTQHMSLSHQRRHLTRGGVLAHAHWDPSSRPPLRTPSGSYPTHAFRKCGASWCMPSSLLEPRRESRPTDPARRRVGRTGTYPTAQSDMLGHSGTPSLASTLQSQQRGAIWCMPGRLLLMRPNAKLAQSGTRSLANTSPAPALRIRLAPCPAASRHLAHSGVCLLDRSAPTPLARFDTPTRATLYS
jgi:hypothetical protein